MDIKEHTIYGRISGYTFILKLFHAKKLKKIISKFLEIVNSGEFYTTLVLGWQKYDKKNASILSKIEKMLKSIKRIEINLLEIYDFDMVHAFANVRAKSVDIHFKGLLSLSRSNREKYLKCLLEVYHISKEAESVKYEIDAAVSKEFVELLPYQRVRKASLTLSLTAMSHISFFSWMSKMLITDISLCFPDTVSSMMHFKRVLGADRTNKRINIRLKPRFYGNFNKMQLFTLLLLKEDVEFVVKNRCHKTLRSQINSRETMNLLNYCCSMYLKKYKGSKVTQNILDTLIYLFLFDMYRLFEKTQTKTEIEWEQA